MDLGVKFFIVSSDLKSILGVFTNSRDAEVRLRYMAEQQGIADAFLARTYAHIEKEVCTYYSLVWDDSGGDDSDEFDED